MRVGARVIAAATLVAAVAGPAVAKDKAAVVDTVIACDQIAGSAERLACFDRTVASLKAARAGDRKSLSDARIERPDFQPVQSTVANVVELDLGRWLIVLPDNSVWQSIDQTRVVPVKGDRVQIRKGFLGSFTGDVGAALGVKLRRLR